MLSDACKKELRRFDTERALVLWDELVSQQQEQLARLGVPTMFVTNGQADREVALLVPHSRKELIYLLPWLYFF